MTLRPSTFTAPNGALKKSQSGVALFISLVMLLIITILGLSSVQTTSLQERMARNSRDSNLAFLAAEAALKDAAESILLYNNLGSFGIDPKLASPRLCLPSPNGANGFYHELDYNCEPNWEKVAWNEPDGGYIVSTVQIDGVASQPKYIVENIKTLVAFEDKLNLTNIGEDLGAGVTQIFRITAYGTGGTDNARVMIQATYGRKF